MKKFSIVLTMLAMLIASANASYAPVTSPIPRLRPNVQNNQPAPQTPEIETMIQIAEHQRQKLSFVRKKKKQSDLESGTNAGHIKFSVSPIPRLRPAKIKISQASGTIAAPKRVIKTQQHMGSVCGVSEIKGRAVARIRGRGGCGIDQPVKITQVAGVDLTRELLVNCSAAIRLNSWVKRSAKPIIGRQDGGLEAIQIISGYSCRTRNSKKGAKLSEHAKGNAIDIAGFKLKNGKIYSVERNWRRGKGSRTLKKLHKSACGPFGTVLGPNSDRHHKDHFHFDIASYRSGAYCR